MSHLQVIAHLEDMLRTALEIINRQAELLELHGIETADGQLEAMEEKLKNDAKGWC
jgi:hypothetical protein